MCLSMKTRPIPRLLDQRTGDSHYHWTKKWGAGHSCSCPLPHPRFPEPLTPSCPGGPGRVSWGHPEWNPEPAAPPVESTVSIEVHDYHKSYGATVAVAGISFRVAPGEI